MKYYDIVKLYEEGELTLEAANARLLEEKAGFRLEPKTDARRAEMSANECADGSCDIGCKPLNLPDRPDMGRKEELANQTVIQETVGGRFKIRYDELGYAVAARKL